MVEKVTIDINDEATFMCPQCGKSKTMDVRRYKFIDSIIKVNCNCPCGNKYTALLERRREPRKTIEISGSYIAPNKEKGFMTINNVSSSGLKFKLFKEKALKKGDKILVSFEIIIKGRKTLIEKEAIIKNVKGLYISAKYFAPNRKELRETCAITVDYTIKGMRHSSFIEDLSAGGAFISTSKSHPVGEKLTLTFTVENQAPFKIQGEITRSTAKGIAVTFADITEAQKKRLTSVVKKIKADSF